MIYLFYTIHVVVCLFLILVVLLQQGKGADLSVFGGGSTQSAFGARGAATLLHKLTVSAFIAFIVTTISIGFLQGHGSRGSVMSTVEESTVPASTPNDAAAATETTVGDSAAEEPAAATDEETDGEPAAEDEAPDSPNEPPSS